MIISKSLYIVTRINSHAVSEETGLQYYIYCAYIIIMSLQVLVWEAGRHLHWLYLSGSHDPGPSGESAQFGFSTQLHYIAQMFHEIWCVQVI